MDVEKAKKDMDMFAAINEQRLYRLYKACVDIQTDLQTLVKSRVSLEDLSYDIV
jgi:sister-chromatid-cohesion protein PDS5